MDYFKILIKASLVILSMISLNGCTGDSDSSEPQIVVVEASPRPLEVLGFPPSKIYYDSLFSYTFGAMGGTGVYKMRYVQNPNEDEDEDDLANPLFMHVQDLTDIEAKPAFKVEVTPEAGDGELQSGSYSYGIEVTDGVNTELDTFEFTLGTNSLTYAGDLSATEGRSNETVFYTLLNARRDGGTFICSQIEDMTFGIRNIDGQNVYPNAFTITMDAPVSKRTTVYYKVTSNYSDSSDERTSSNVNAARPGADYIQTSEAENSVVFEAGESRCVIVVDIIDDNIIESEETMRIQFTRVEGALLSLDLANSELVISDDEPQPRLSPASQIVNEGDSVNIPITLSAGYSEDLEVLVSVNQDKTTASNTDYTILPETGVLEIPAGKVQSGFTVLVNEDNDEDNDSAEDEVIIVKTDLDDILDVEASEFTINEWRENLIVGNGATNPANSMTIDDNGYVSVLRTITSGDNTGADIISYDRRGRSQEIISNPYSSFSKAGVNVKPLAIFSSLTADEKYLTVVLEVDDQYGSIHRGGSDFVVLVLEQALDSKYTLISTKQYGSENNDIVNGVKLADGYLYVFGESDGRMLDGLMPTQINSGGTDGFIYRINIAENVADWSRYIGSADNDGVADIAVGTRDISVLMQRENPVNGNVRIVSVDAGLDREGITFPIIATGFDDNVVAINYDQNNSGYRALFDSAGVLPAGTGQSDTLSKDVQVAFYDSESLYRRSLLLGTSGTDTATEMISAVDGENIIVVGQTDGAFDGETNFGKQDAFVAILKIADGGIAATDSIKQFGGSEVDRVIDVKEFSEHKFLVLWSEQHTEPGQETYRISAFSMEGRMLSE